MMPCSQEIIHEPHGLCLIISPYNYPFNLTLSPLIGAIAAGNVCVIKPSELTPACEALLARLIVKYLDPDCFRVYCGDHLVASALLKEPWDFIFYTGSTRVGRIVAAAAAEHLTPIVLELGGKSPTYIDSSVTDLQLVTKRILWGKMLNAGQTCIAPDYLMVHEAHYDSFLALAITTLRAFYGDDPQKSPDFARIVSRMHCLRLKGLLDASGGRVLCGGEVDVDARYVSPTLLTDLSPASAVMGEEIFGPLLPIFKVSGADEAIEMVRRTKQKPLALYLFGKDRRVIDKVISKVNSGGVLVNDVIYHIGNPEAPLGGVGESGMGGYRGKHSLEAFSRKRNVMRRDDHMLLDAPVRYPPYSDFGLKLFRALSPYAVPAFSWPSASVSALVVALAGIALYFYKGS